MVARAINDLLGGRDTFLPILQANILQVLENNSSGKIAEIDHRLVEQQQKLVKLANGKKDYNAVADEIHSLREQRQKVLAQDAEHDGQKKHIEELKAFLEEQKDISVVKSRMPELGTYGSVGDIPSNRCFYPTI